MSELEALRSKTAEGPWLLLFGAKWAPPSLILDKAVRDTLPEGLSYLFLDVESEGPYADLHNVVTIPTIITLVTGRELDRRVGAVSASEMISMARTALNYSNKA